LPIILFESGPQEGLLVRISPGDSLLFGRDPQASIPLEDQGASRAHFRIKEHRGSFFLKDLGSTNGTRVNDVRVEDVVRLSYRDRIQVGATVATFLPEDGAPAGPDTGSAALGDEPTDGFDEEIPLSPGLPATETGAEGDDPLMGRTLGGYRILKVEGRGGMGTVYRALQISLNREVALKVLSRELTSDETFVQLFLQEARAAGQLNHPNIVQVYDVGNEEDLYFYSMEYIPLGSVEDILREEGSLSVENSTAAVLDAARGLVYAERKKLVHRDIKPENLMIGEDGLVKIADLGLAKSLAEGSGKAGSEGILGTPHFISPEQALGKEVDTRSDLYSLGASFYRMVSGKNPFSGRRVKDILRAQIHETPPSLVELDPEIPEDVSAVVDRLMRKDPAERFQSAEELVQSLEEIQRIHHYGAPRRSMAILVSTVILAAAAVVIAFIVRGTDDSPAPDPLGDREAPVTILTPSPTSEAERQALLEEKAEVAFGKVRLDEQKEGATSRVLTAYRTVGQDYTGTIWAQRALERADEVEAEIQRNERLASELADRRRGFETSATEAIASDVAQSRYAAALGLWETFPQRAEIEADPDAARRYEDLRRGVLEASTKFVAERSKEIEEALVAENVPQAWAIASALDLDASFGEGDGDLAPLRTRTRELIERVRARAASWQEARYSSDRRLFLDAFGQMQGHLMSIELAAAAESLVPLRTTLQTEPYAELLERWILLTTCARDTFGACTRALADHLVAGGEEIHLAFPGGPSDEDAILERLDPQGPTLARSVARQRVSQSYLWSDYKTEPLLLIDLLVAGARAGGIETTRIAVVAALLGLPGRSRALLGTDSPDAVEDPIRVLVLQEIEAERHYARARALFDQKQFEPALDALELLSSRYCQTRAYLSRSDGTSLLVERTSLLAVSPSPSTEDEEDGEDSAGAGKSARVVSDPGEGDGDPR
jgi:serine/threonine-protein kinase